MAKEIPSVGDLRRKSEMTKDEAEAAIAAYLKDEHAGQTKAGTATHPSHAAHNEL